MSKTLKRGFDKQTSFRIALCRGGTIGFVVLVHHGGALIEVFFTNKVLGGVRRKQALVGGGGGNVCFGAGLV